MDKKILLTFPHKKIRSKVIKEYIKNNYTKIVCYSCGNAGRALEELNLDVLHIGEEGTLDANKWFSMKEINHYFHEYFDATSGHLNIELMQLISKEYLNYFGQNKFKPYEEVYVPTGSGETLICLKIAYPQTNFVAVYNLGKETEYNPNAPLNKLVELLSSKIIFDGLNYNWEM